MQQKLKDKQVEGKTYKKKKIQQKNAPDERDSNILGQLSQLNKSVVVIDEQGREVDEKEKELEKKRTRAKGKRITEERRRKKQRKLP